MSAGYRVIDRPDDSQCDVISAVLIADDINSYSYRIAMGLIIIWTAPETLAGPSTNINS